MAEQFLVSGQSPDTVYSTLVQKGLSASEASRFVGDWINVVARGGQPFNYVQPFPQTVATCADTFVRKFVHQDWVDGESTVQAQQSTGELGFNARFHAIEGDLDSLGANLAMAFACMADLRNSLFALLAEIRTEFNRLENLVAASTGPRLAVPGGGLVAGQSSFLGTTTLNNQTMTMWQTSAGVMMLPGATTINPDPANDPRVQRAGTLAGYIAQNQPAIAAAFGAAAFTKEQFLAKFGTQTAADGSSVSDLLSIEPAGTSFASPSALVNDVSTREAAALRTTAGSSAAVASALGVTATTGAVGSASVAQFTALPQDAKAALIAAGVDTMGKLASTDPQQVSTILTKAGVQSLSAVQAADVTTRAKTLVNL